MSLEDLDTILRIMLYVLLFAWMVSNISRKRALPRTAARYGFATLTILFGLLLEADMAGRATIMFIEEDPFGAGMFLFPMLLVASSIREAFNDSNWFNDQFDNLKKGFKNLTNRLSRIHLAFPSPLPSPA